MEASHPIYPRWGRALLQLSLGKWQVRMPGSVSVVTGPSLPLASVSPLVIMWGKSEVRGQRSGPVLSIHSFSPPPAHQDRMQPPLGWAQPAVEWWEWDSEDWLELTKC